MTVCVMAACLRLDPRAVRIWTESADPFRRRAATFVRIDPFGFSWRQTVSPRKPSNMPIGFPWISLDSLVRIETYQWFTRHPRDSFFHSASSLASGAGTGTDRPGRGGRAEMLIGQTYLSFWFLAIDCCPSVASAASVEVAFQGLATAQGRGRSVAKGNSDRLRRAESTPTEGALGRTGVWAKAGIPVRARNSASPPSGTT